MINGQLNTYINKSLSEGIPKEEIETNLLSTGWKKEDIDNAFSCPTSGLPGWTEIIKKTLEIYKSKALKIICLYILAMIFVLAIFGAILGIMALYSTFIKSFTGQGLIFVALILGAALVILIAIFSAIYLGTWPIVASIFIVGNDVGIKDSLRSTKKMVWKYYWANFLVGLIIFAGIILLVIPGIVFAAWLSLTSIVLIYENLDSVGACARSRKLVSKNFWWVVRKMVLITLILIIISTVLQQFKNVPIVVILTPLINLLLVPVTTIYSYLIYKSLRDQA
jgi:hypothetical protein